MAPGCLRWWSSIFSSPRGIEHRHFLFASVGAVELRGGQRRPFCMPIVDVFRTFPLVVVSCLIVCPDERAIRTHKDWVVWSRAQPVKGDCTLRGFEQEGKAVFQGKVKRFQRSKNTKRREQKTRQRMMLQMTKLKEAGRTSSSLRGSSY